MAAQFDISALLGEPGTGFEKRGSMGPFECSNCLYFINGNACNEKNMKAKSKFPKWPDGTIKVAAEDCCSYIERIGINSRK